MPDQKASIYNPVVGAPAENADPQFGAPRRPGEEARSLGETKDVIARWLEEREPLSRPVVRFLSRPVGAGGSNETILFEIEATLAGKRDTLDLVLRIEPGDYRLFHKVDLQLQFSLLGHLHSNARIAVPEPLWFEPETRWFGRPFYVMRKVAGKVPVSSPPYNLAGFLFDAEPAQRRRAWQSAIEELAHIHCVETGPLETIFGVSPAAGIQAHFEEQVAAFHWAAAGRDAPFLASTLDWLRANRPKQVKPGLGWGDARIGNMIFGADFHLAGVLDWEQASLGGALSDLGWWLFFDDLYSAQIGCDRLPGMGDRTETIGLWSELTGHSADDLEWHEVFAGFQLGTLMMRRCDLQQHAPPAANRNNNLFTRKLAGMLGLNNPTDIGL